MGLALSVLICVELLVLDKTHDNQIAPLSLTVWGLSGAVLTLLGDKIYYMNRDDNTWIYIGLGLSGILVLLAGFFSIKGCRRGCKCCMCSCCQGEEGCCLVCCKEGDAREDPSE